MNTQHPIIDAIQLYRIDSARKYRLARVRQRRLAGTNAHRITGELDEWVRDISGSESAQARKEIGLARQVGIEIVTHRVADYARNSGTLFLCVFQELEIPSTQPGLVI